MLNESNLRHLIQRLVDLGQIFLGLVRLTGGHQFFELFQSRVHFFLAFQIKLATTGALAESFFRGFCYWHLSGFIYYLVILSILDFAVKGYNKDIRFYDLYPFR